MKTVTDYYNRLNLSPDATEDNIRQAYRKLARRYHPDVNSQPDAKDRFQKIQEAYEMLSDPTQRKRYDHWRSQQGLDKSAALSVQAIASHKVLQPLAEEQAYYVLLDIMPVAHLPISRLPLNLCLVIDKSTSMQGSRLQKVKEAINQIVDKLQPDDALSLVTFSDRAEVLLPSRRNVERSTIKSVVSTIQAGGGTEILQGLQAGLKEIESSQSKTSIDHLILLTDGQTYGDEQACLEQAKWAGANQIHFSTIGMGSDWNEDLLDQMATLSEGSSIYIDSPHKLKNIFEEIMQNLESIVARNLTMKLNLNSNIRLHEAYQISPYISPLETNNNQAMLGSLSANQNLAILLEFRVKRLTLGERRLMRILVEGDMPSQTKHRPWEWIELNVHVSEQVNHDINIPTALTTALSKLAIYKMQEKVAADVKVGHIASATQRLKLIATRLLDVDEAHLANVALLEAGQLERTKNLSAAGRKTIRYGTRTLTVPSKESPQLSAIPTM